MNTPAQDRLEYLRGELRAERISYAELNELQALAPHIQAGDVELLEAAGVPETPAKPDLVIFRKFPEGDVIALFPTQPFDYTGRLCNSYMHVGQHAGADYYGLIPETRPATPDEYADLSRELTRIGYNLKPIARAGWKLHRQRREEARSL